MYVHELAVGERAPDNVDLVVVTERRDGKFRFECVVWTEKGKAYFMADRRFESAAEAKEAGLKWTEANGAQTLFVEYRK